jgi:hypothetical protein
MKKLSIIIMSLVVMSSCSTTKEAKTSRAEIRNEKKLAEQSMVKNAVETRRYIIKLNRLYFNHGGNADLIPRANFIIIDGINMRGRAVDYALTNNTSRGSYDIKVTVRNGRTASFDLYINVTKNGFCSASVSSLKIDNIRYSGYLVPISDRTNKTLQKGDPI